MESSARLLRLKALPFGPRGVREENVSIMDSKMYRFLADSKPESAKTAYLPSAALSSGVSSLSECDNVDEVLFVLPVMLPFSFACAGCPVRISLAISCAVSLPCSYPSVAKSLKCVDTATAEMIAAMATPEIIKMLDLLFI